MLIGYTPLDWTTAPTVSIAGGTWLTTDGGSACVDGDPSRVARYEASGTASITLTMPSGSRSGVAAILGIRGVAVGAPVSVMTGGVTTPGQVQQFADGSRGCIFIINAAAGVANHLDEFVRQFRWMLTSRDEFDRLKRLPPDTLTDIQRAARFYYLQRLAFGGKVCSQTFGTCTASPKRINLLRLEEDLSAAHMRLHGVVIEQLSSI